MSATKILLVDDFELVRTMLRTSLGEIGYENFEEASDGIEALTILYKAHEIGAPIDVVFCDWNMPKKTGIEVLEEMRKSAEFASIPFIMVTAESEHENVVRALMAGATDYIIKPIEPQVLARKVERIFSRTLKVS